MLQPAIWTKHNVGSDDAVWTDDCARAEFYPGINNGGRMNLHVTHFSEPLTSILSPWYGERRKERRRAVRHSLMPVIWTPRPL